MAGFALAPVAIPDTAAKTDVSIGVNIGMRLPNGAVKLKVGKNDYHYHDGRYYRKTNRGHVVVRAPRGAVIHRLPRGYTTVVLGGRTYFRFDGVYYTRNPYGYIVVDAPTVVHVKETSSEVVSTKSAAPEQVSVWLDDSEFLLMDGQFFRKSPDGLVWIEPPYGALSNELPQGTKSIWYKEIEYFEHKKVYLRKTPDGYEVIPAPWAEAESS